MTTAQVRSIIQDKAHHFVDSIVFDGVTKVFRLTYSPVVTGSVVTTPAPDTIDYETGVISYVTAPAAATAPCDYDTTVLSDSDISNIVQVESDNAGTDDARVIAADCLDAMASNQALLLKRIKLLDLDTDGPSLAKALREHANSLRDLAYNPKYSEPCFDFAEQVNDSPGYREKIVKDVMREIG